MPLLTDKEYQLLKKFERQAWLTDEELTPAERELMPKLLRQGLIEQSETESYESLQKQRACNPQQTSKHNKRYLKPTLIVFIGFFFGLLSRMFFELFQGI